MELKFFKSKEEKYKKIFAFLDYIKDWNYAQETNGKIGIREYSYYVMNNSIVKRLLKEESKGKLDKYLNKNGISFSYNKKVDNFFKEYPVLGIPFYILGIAETYRNNNKETDNIDLLNVNIDLLANNFFKVNKLPHNFEKLPQKNENGEEIHYSNEDLLVDMVKQMVNMDIFQLGSRYSRLYNINGFSFYDFYNTYKPNYADDSEYDRCCDTYGNSTHSLKAAVMILVWLNHEGIISDNFLQQDIIQMDDVFINVDSNPYAWDIKYNNIFDIHI